MKSQIRKIIREVLIENFDDRKLGKRISDIKGAGYTKVYRAVPNDVDEFKNKDYVTFSLKFAVEHAENNEVYHEEPQKVIYALISNDKLYDAYNPGEYFYSGPDLKAKTIYNSKGYDYEGWDELTKDDFNF